jgi:hypothetical protein
MQYICTVSAGSLWVVDESAPLWTDPCTGPSLGGFDVGTCLPLVQITCSIGKIFVECDCAQKWYL